MYIQKRNLLVSALCSDMMLQSNLPNMWTPQGKSQVSTLQGCLLQSNVLNTDTKGTEPTLQTEVSVLQRCLYYSQTTLIQTLRGQNQVSTLQRCLYCSQTSIIQTPKGQNQVATLQRCLY